MSTEGGRSWRGVTVGFGWPITISCMLERWHRCMRLLCMSEGARYGPWSPVPWLLVQVRLGRNLDVRWLRGDLLVTRGVGVGWGRWRLHGMVLKARGRVCLVDL